MFPPPIRPKYWKGNYIDFTHQSLFTGLMVSQLFVALCHLPKKRFDLIVS